MTSKQLSKERKDLLVELEYLVGQKCYNGNTHNYGPGGVFEHFGRSFRYPLTIRNPKGEKRKISGKAAGLKKAELDDAYYAFGANELNIIDALDDVLQFLERKYNFKV